MNQKQLLLFLLATLFFNCSIQLDNNTRIETLGKVVDENNQPLSNVFVGVYTESPGIIISGNNNQFLLGDGNSDESGNFSVASLGSSGQSFYVFINGGSTHTSYRYTTRAYDFESENHEFNLDEIQLKTKARVNVNISRSSSSGTTLEFSINYPDRFCEEIFNNGVLDETLSNCHATETIIRTLDDENPDFTTSFNAFVSGEIEFSYSVNGAPQITENFIIDQDNYDINFSY